MARSGPGITTLLGFVVGLGALLAGFLLDGGSILSLIGIPALIVIVDGTFGALLVSFNLADVLAIPRHVLAALRPARNPSPQLAESLIPGDLPEARAQNRRVDILILVPP